MRAFAMVRTAVAVLAAAAAAAAAAAPAATQNFPMTATGIYRFTGGNGCTVSDFGDATSLAMDQMTNMAIQKCLLDTNTANAKNLNSYCVDGSCTSDGAAATCYGVFQCQP